ncbi:3-methyladenine DNA glycosylase [Lentzea sp. NBRC 105346]|uniref:3-methyladenine DNA glycosylase n=1 Tax=Lentzea sp. NBRC 105346 TaxID=3032205 RepID=UPI0025579C01|nr:3-methyladenine DNA glycosylase [Lentzea sp. NBRC 105346]
MRKWTGPHLERKLQKQKHPVLDFLFTYYSHRPVRLERWHPGPNVVLEDAPEYEEIPHYKTTKNGVTLDLESFTEARGKTLAFVEALLTATLTRQPRLNCFGLHEWAMVYRQTPEQVRHNAWPLRLGKKTDEVVENSKIQCGHFDAFRFFTEDARPRNTIQPTRDTQTGNEQPGCLHGNMDLFKWAYKLEPATPSELVADCFELAVEIRELDMKASPYDLEELGYAPIRIEDPQGRAEYVRQQSRFAERAEPLRHRLISLCRVVTRGTSHVDTTAGR